MAKRVYFAFHYQDVCDFRAKVVRNHRTTKPHREAARLILNAALLRALVSADHLNQTPQTRASARGLI